MARGTQAGVLGLVVLLALGGSSLAQDAAPIVELGIADQETSGHALIVDAARLAQPGFVVIHDETVEAGGGTDSILGSSRVLSPTLHFDVLVRIDPPLERDQRVIAMLHVDSNHNGVFDLARTGTNDRPYLSSGQPVTDDANIDVLDDRAASLPAGVWSVLAVLAAALVLGGSR